MNLGFDLDEVIGQTAQMAVSYMNEVFECEYNIDVLNSFQFQDNIFSDVPEEQEAVVNALIYAVKDEELMATVQPYPNAVKVLNKLKHLGHKIFIITKRPKEHTEMTYKWLYEHNIAFDELILTHYKDKGGFARLFKLDMFVDDLEHNLYDMYKNKARWHKGLFLMTRPWNKNNYIDASKFTRVNNWTDVLQVTCVRNRLKV